jgi:hypothetical protein
MIPEALRGREEVGGEGLSEEFRPLVAVKFEVSEIVLLVESDPRGNEAIQMKLFRQSEILLFNGDALLIDLVDLLPEPDHASFPVDLLEDVGPLIDADNNGGIVENAVLDKRIAIPELVVVNVLVEERVFIEGTCQISSEMVRPVRQLLV